MLQIFWGNPPTPITGVGALTFDDFTVAGDGSVVSSGISGAGDIAFDDFAASGVGTVAIQGASAFTFDDFTVSGDGVVVSGVVGDGAFTLDDFVVSGAGLSPGPSPSITPDRYDTLTAYNDPISLVAYN